MTASLDNVTLPDDLDWTDEFDWQPVSQVTTPTLTGALVVEEAALQAGRPITLVSDGAAWVTRATVKKLQALLAKAGETMTLTLSDGRTFSVLWRRGDGPSLTARQILRRRLADTGDDYHYEIELHLMEAPE